MPNTSFSQIVGVVGMTGTMSLHVVTIAGIILILAGLLPKILNRLNANASFGRWCDCDVRDGGRCGNGRFV